MPTALVARARVFVDSRAGALKEAGDILLPIGEGAIDETAHRRRARRGRARAGSPADSRTTDVTIFKSLGMAVEDVVAARLVVERARAAGLGRRSSLPDDATGERAACWSSWLTASASPRRREPRSATPRAPAAGRRP